MKIIARNIKNQGVFNYEVFLHFFEYCLERLTERFKTDVIYKNYKPKDKIGNKVEDDGVFTDCKYISFNDKIVVIDFSDLAIRIKGISIDHNTYIKNEKIKCIIKPIILDNEFSHYKHYDFYKYVITDFWFYPYNYFYKNVIRNIDQYKKEKIENDIFGVFGPSKERKIIIDEMNRIGIKNSCLRCTERRDKRDKYYVEIDEYYKKSFSSKVNLVIPGGGIASYQRFYDSAFAGIPCMMMEPVVKMTIKPVPYIHYIPINNIIRKGNLNQKLKQCKIIIEDFNNLINDKEKYNFISNNVKCFYEDNLTYEKMYLRLVNLLECRGII
jgi:hypothetical protein